MNLNLKQKKILKLLSINCRFTNKDIAKSVGLSEDAVAYQIKSLINKNHLAKFNTQFVHFNLGYKSHHIWIKLKERKIPIQKIKSIPHVNSINSNLGKYDYQILVYTKTKKDLQETLRYIRKKIKPKTLHHAELKGIYKSFTNIHPEINVKVKTPKNIRKFEYTLNSETYKEPIPGAKNTLDKTDKKIIKQLIKNPRIKFQDLHVKTNIPTETIRYRMKNYIKTRLINNFGLIHDFKKYNTHLTYFLFNLKKIQEKQFSKYLKNNSNIMYAAKLEGHYNCILYVLSKTPEDIFETYTKILDHLAESTEESDLLLFDKVEKYTQFPTSELKS